VGLLFQWFANWIGWEEARDSVWVELEFYHKFYF
jgi:hypothetical protein